MHGSCREWTQYQHSHDGKVKRWQRMPMHTGCHNAEKQSPGFLTDIREVLKLEPRHFGALAGMGLILQREGLDKSALVVYRKALTLNPQQPELHSLVEKLTLEVEGRDI